MQPHEYLGRKIRTVLPASAQPMVDTHLVMIINTMPLQGTVASHTSGHDRRNRTHLSKERDLTAKSKDIGSQLYRMSLQNRRGTLPVMPSSENHLSQSGYGIN